MLLVMIQTNGDLSELASWIPKVHQHFLELKVVKSLCQWTMYRINNITLIKLSPYPPSSLDLMYRL